MANDFIFELGCEELPSGAVWLLADELAKHVLASLDKAQLSYGSVKIFAAPRRFGLMIEKLQAEQMSQITVRKGPAAAAAYDDKGQPTQALLGFAKSCGVAPEQLKRINTDKGDWIVCELHSTAHKTNDLLPNLMKQALAHLPIAKPMRWGNGDDEFVRPVHWVVMLYGEEVLECELLGVSAGRYSRGHRFHAPDELYIDSPADYEMQLQDSFVIADFARRRQIIKEQVEKLAHAHHATAVMPEDLLDEVTSIVEWPRALMAHFAEEFLEVPAEALIASMQSHQKCFALKDSKGALLPCFIAVANIDSTNPEQVIAGNEKVMHARLSDAAFFFRQDKKRALSQHIPTTERVVFQSKLGSLYDKALRIKNLMSYLSPSFGLIPTQAERAALLSKCDLLSGMVGEFPELQGLMGYYYALHDGEDPPVAHALNEQYMPRFAADELPKSSLGLALSLADRMDTLVGIFAIGQKPSGVKDPFKLRRHALAVVRMLITQSVSLNLSTLIHEAVIQYKPMLTIEDSLRTELKTFILERAQSYYQAQGFSLDLIHAVRACQEEWVYDLDKRLHALKRFVTMPEAVSLSAACKRVNNLLNSAEMDVHVSLPEVKEGLLVEEVEKNLYQKINELSLLVAPLYAAADYDALLKHLASIREPVDLFFDEVMVLVDDIAVKQNRLALLLHLRTLLQGVADISLLQLQHT